MVAGGAAFAWLQLEHIGELLAEFLRIGDAVTLIVFHDILFEILGGIVFQIEHFFEWTHFVVRVAMALKAEAHRMRFCMIHNLHLIDLTVAADTGDSAVDVRAVAEFHVIGRLVNLHPLDRLTVIKWMRFVHRAVQRLQLGTIAFHVLVAVPTGVRRRQVRVVGMIDK